MRERETREGKKRGRVTLCVCLCRNLRCRPSMRMRGSQREERARKGGPKQTKPGSSFTRASRCRQQGAYSACSSAVQPRYGHCLGGVLLSSHAAPHVQAPDSLFPFRPAEIKGKPSQCLIPPTALFTRVCQTSAFSTQLPSDFGRKLDISSVQGPSSCPKAIEASSSTTLPRVLDTACAEGIFFPTRHRPDAWAYHELLHIRTCRSSKLAAAAAAANSKKDTIT